MKINVMLETGDPKEMSLNTPSKIDGTFKD